MSRYRIRAVGVMDHGKNVDMWMNAWISTAIHIADEPARFLTMWVIRRFWEDYDSVHWYDRAL